MSYYILKQFCISKKVISTLKIAANEKNAANVK